MKPIRLAWVSLALVTAGSVFASCGDDSSSNGVNAGLGVKCASDKECTPYALLCDQTLKLCTECMTSADCPAGQACGGNRCHAVVTCKNSLDCSGQVCDQAKGQCVGCLTDNDCSRSSYCFRNECIPLVTTGDTGAGGFGNPTTGSGGGDPGVGGAGPAGASGVGGSVVIGVGGAAGAGLGGSLGNGGNGGSGMGGSLGNGGNGGSAMTCMCFGGLACTVDGKCVFPHDIHTSLTCDGSIAQIGGRSGKWYGFASAGNGYQLGFGDPGPTWHQHTCAVYFVGGPNGLGGATNSAGIGVQLAGGAVYRLGSYNGIKATMEGGQRTMFIVKTAGGGYFGAFVAATGTAVVDRSVLWSQLLPMANSLEATLSINTATEIQFSPEFPSMAWGFALYAINLTP